MPPPPPLYFLIIATAPTGFRSSIVHSMTSIGDAPVQKRCRSGIIAMQSALPLLYLPSFRICNGVSLFHNPFNELDRNRSGVIAIPSAMVGAGPGSHIWRPAATPGSHIWRPAATPPPLSSFPFSPTGFCSSIRHSMSSIDNGAALSALSQCHPQCEGSFLLDPHSPSPHPARCYQGARARPESEPGKASPANADCRVTHCMRMTRLSAYCVARHKLTCV